MKQILLIIVLLSSSVFAKSNPIHNLIERVAPGSSSKFKIELVKSPIDNDFFELDQQKEKVVIRGNNYVSIATGLNWYLKYYASTHLSWNCMKVELPQVLPPVATKTRRETNQLSRYYLNYCTFSYSMAFWDWERWEKEIDWMAVHGINIPLAITGTETVWYNVLTKLGYSKAEINEFIAGAGFLAWWQMNNLEGWGGPNSDNWYKQQAELQKKIVKRMRQLGIEPALPGYAGMMPRNAKEKLNLNVSDPGKWNSFPRPSFLQPSDSEFSRIADLYYTEMTKLFGKSKYYAIDPFHEGGSTKGVDMDFAGKAIMNAMKKANPEAVWVAQAWQANPRPEMVNSMNKGDILVLDLFSESRPMWGPEWSSWYRADGYGKHDWIFCMLLNFGGRTGMFGKMETVINQYYDAKVHKNGHSLKGIGATMEAIENNPVMFELLFELPWRTERFSKDEWLKNYTKARYTKSDETVNEAWQILSKTVYACPMKSTQEGSTETVFAASPRLDVGNVSCCSTTRPFYNTDSVALAAEKMLSVANQYRGINNFEYDLVDLVRQTIANKAYYLQKEVTQAYKDKNVKRFDELSQQFLSMMLAQDSLLQTRPEFMLGSWTNQARKLGKTTNEKDLYEWNARTQITTWGNRASIGILNNYAYKEWAGVLSDVYYVRWKTFFDDLSNELKGQSVSKIDYYAMDEAWNSQHNYYSNKPTMNPIEMANKVFTKYIKN